MATLMDDTAKVVKRGVSLYREDWAYLDEQARRYGTSASAMIRRLIRNEQETNDRTQPTYIIPQMTPQS